MGCLSTPASPMLSILYHAIVQCGDETIDYCDKYKYFGLVLDEFLDFNVTASYVIRSANRAIGLLIAKFKVLGGMPYNVYTKLFDSMVWSFVAYGVAVWGTQICSCTDAIQTRSSYALLSWCNKQHAIRCRFRRNGMATSSY
jgi:hypothetical protein